MLSMFPSGIVMSGIANLVTVGERFTYIAFAFLLRKAFQEKTDE